MQFQQSKGNGLWSPGFFDQLKPAKESDHKHLRIWVHGPGFGGTLVGIRKGRPDDPFAPKVGYACPITTTLDFSSRQRTKGSPHSVTIALHDPTLQQTVRLGEKTQPLAYDLSAPLGHYPRANSAVMAIRGLLRADKISQRVGLYMVEPYDPNRIPIVLVHGLLSTPHMWFNNGSVPAGTIECSLLACRFGLEISLFTSNGTRCKMRFYLSSLAGRLRILEPNHVLKSETIFIR